MFGYDFMVDVNYNPWLIEVNSSPGLEGIEGATEVDVAGAIVEYIEYSQANDN